MKTKTNARVLAWLLSICLIVGIIPALPAEYATAAGNVLKYDFSGLAASTITLTPATESKYGDSEIYGTYDYDYTKAAGSAEWAIHSVARTNTTNAGAYVQIYNNKVFRLFSKYNYYITLNLKIKVKEAGKYVPYINNKQWNADKTTFKVSLYTLADNGGFDQIVFTNTDVQANESGNGYKLSEAVYLEADTEYGLQFHSTGANPASGENNPLVDISNFTLVEVVEEIVPSADIPTLLSINESVEASFAAKLGDQDLGAQFEVASSDDSVVSVTESNGTYTFKGEKDGFATVTVTATYGENEKIVNKYNIAVRNAPSTYTYYFSGMVNEDIMTFSETNTGKSGDKLAADVITYDSTAANNSYPWKIYGTYRSGVANPITARNTFIKPDCIEITNDGGSTSNVQIGVKVPVSGYYTVKTDAAFEDGNTNGKLTIYAEKASGGLIADPVYSNQTEIEDVFNVDKIYLEAYDASAATPISNYRFYFESNNKGATLYSMTLVPYVEPVEITNAEIFGDVSAYITNDRKFTALAGIDCTSYKEVGFYIAYNGNNIFEKCAVSDGKVYKNIKIDWVSSSRDISYTDFFPTTAAKGNDPYIFFSSMTFSSALPSSVEFYPYAVDMNGNEIKGHTYSVTLS